MSPWATPLTTPGCTTVATPGFVVCHETLLASRTMDPKGWATHPVRATFVVVPWGISKTSRLTFVPLRIGCVKYVAVDIAS